MFTVCPKCALTLVVTAADLRIAQGYVRCGRCLNVFNALARLSEERPAAAPQPLLEPQQQQTAAPAEPSAASPALEETGEIGIELDATALATSTSAAIPPPPAPEVPETPSASLELAAGASAPAAAPPDSGVAPHAVEETPGDTEPAQEEPTAAAAPPAAASPPESPLVESPLPESPPVGSPPPELPLVESQLAVRGDLPPTATAQPEPTVPVESATAPAEAAGEPAANSPPPTSESAFELRAKPPRAPLAWNLAAGVLAAALALQIVNHYRSALAAHPALAGPLRTVYSALGVKLAPRWNIHAYDVRQLGASVAGAAAGEIIVRASVMNAADRAQPLPLLRVTLQDRFGNRIATRDVPPGDYLPAPAAPAALLAAGSRVDATMAFVDPGPQAVGFEIDACLPQPNGAVACAHGPE